MRIAVACEGNLVSGHFGHCEGFIVYDVLDNKVQNKVFVQNPGHRPGYLPVFLKEKGTDIIISGGMGETAQQLFAENGIKVVVGAEGLTDEVVDRYIKGRIVSTGSICNEHQHEGQCYE